MTLRLAHSWQVILADLSLILFIATAAALDASEPTGSAEAPPPAAAASMLPVTQMTTSQEAEPSAIFRVSPDADFARWLADHPADPRERLTIQTRYAPGKREQANADGEALAMIALQQGFEPRLVIEPAPIDETIVLFAFAGKPQLAR